MSELAIRDEGHYLATVADVRSLAERIESVEGAKDLADRARAAQVWAQRARLGQEQVNLASVAKLWAERRAGQLLSESGLTTKPVRQLPEGVSKTQSHRWQKLAAIPAGQFASAVEKATEEGSVSASRVERIADETLGKRIQETFFAKPPAFTAFWKACDLLIQKARPDAAQSEDWDPETRALIRRWAPLMVERIEALEQIAAQPGHLSVVEGGNRVAS